MTTRRASLISGIGFESLVIAALVMGCSSSTTNNNPPTNIGGSTSSSTSGGTTSNGGGTGAAAGGTTSSVGGTKAAIGGAANPTGGAATVATGGAVATSTGGAVSATTGGAVTISTGGAATGTDTGGAATGTTGGANGATTGGAATAGTGGSTVVDCNPPVTTQCTGTAPPAALISDFTIASGSTTPPVFGTYGKSVYGGEYVYPTTTPACGTTTVDAHPLTQDVSGGSWLIQGTVGTYSGAGFWWQCNTGTTAAPTYAGICTIDASAYTGISFTISGTIGPVSSGTGTVGLTMQVTTPSTQAPAKNTDGTPATDSAGNPKPNCGTCTATTCGGTNVSVPVTATASTVTMTWAQLGVTTPNAITSITFAFTDPFGLNGGYNTTPPTATPYPVNVTIDNIQFTM